MNDDRTGCCCGWTDEQGRKILLDPRERTFVRLLCSCVIVEYADGRHSVVRCIDHIIGYETLDITDDRNGTLLDPAGQLFGHATPCFALTDGGVHGVLLPGWLLDRECDCTRTRIKNNGTSSKIPASTVQHLGKLLHLILFQPFRHQMI